MRRSPVFYGWAVLAAGFTLILFGYAMRNTFSVFYPVIVADFGWTRGGTAIMYSLTILSYGLFAPVAGGLADRFNPKLVLAVGGTIVGGGIALCSFATSMSYFYLVYGVLVAIGLSLIGITPLTAVLTHWFGRERGGMVFGLLGSGFGVSLVSAPLFQWLISSYGWRHAYVVIGLFAVAVIVPVSLVVVRRSPQQQALLKPARPSSAVPGGPTSAAHEWTVRHALHTRFLRLMLLVGFCNMGFSQQVIIAHQVYFLRDIGHDPMVAASVFGVFGVAFATGNVSSSLSDRFGRLLFIVAGCLATAGGIILLLKVAPVPDSPALALVYAVLAGWGLGVTPPSCFAAAADRLHGRHYGAIQGTIILVTSVGGALGAWAGGALHDVTGSYDTPFLIVVVMLLLAAGLAALATRPSSMPSGE